MSERWAKGSTAQWRATRVALFELKGRRCLLAIPGTWVTRNGETRRCLGVATQVHHTRDRRVVGDDLQYLVPACQPCNRKAGDPTSGDTEPAPATKW